MDKLLSTQKDAGCLRLILNGVNIKCLTNAPVFIKKAKKVIVILNEGTQNFLTDGITYNQVDGEPDGALFSNSYMAIAGSGLLSVTASFNDGISGDDGVVIKSGIISVTAKDDGIRGKDYLVIREGNITVNSTGDGLKSDNETDTGKGYISIDTGVFEITTTNGDAIYAINWLKIKDGTFNIVTGGGAITAGGYTSAISKKGLKATNSVTIEKGNLNINSIDDAIHSDNAVVIDDAIINIATSDDAIHANNSITVNNGSITVNRCYEGVERAFITFEGGNHSFISTDDTFNGTKGTRTEFNDGSCVTINGGFIVLNPSGGDGLDSNGNIVMTGGTVIVHGPQSRPEVGIDVNGSFNISGGFLIATGPNSGNMIEGTSATSSQYGIIATTTNALSSSTLFHIQDANGNDIVTYKPVRNIYYVVFSSPAMQTGIQYSILTAELIREPITMGYIPGEHIPAEP
ncbi:MAG: carbohydrate-binding domain-containing protein [Bacteroidales bacterium]